MISFASTSFHYANFSWLSGLINISLFSKRYPRRNCSSWPLQCLEPCKYGGHRFLGSHGLTNEMTCAKIPKSCFGNAAFVFVNRTYLVHMDAMIKHCSRFPNKFLLFLIYSHRWATCTCRVPCNHITILTSWFFFFRPWLESYCCTVWSTLKGNAIKTNIIWIYLLHRKMCFMQCVRST